MKTFHFVAALAVTLFACGIRAAEVEEITAGTRTWHIADVYKYCQSNIDGNTSDEVKARCARFFIHCQDSKTGNFVDAYGDAYYSVKVYHVLKRLGYAPKYPLAVCQEPDADWGQIDGEPVTEQMTPEDFRQWLKKIYQTESAYAAGASFSHFMTPHVINLEEAGKTAEDSPFVPIFRQWLIDHRGENGFWNRPDDTDYSGWNGVMKMDTALKAAHVPIPHPERMIRTVLKHQRQEDGNFTTAGGCTNHNALHTLRQWSKRNEMLMWQDIFLAMEHFADCLQRRYDPSTGYFRHPPGFNNAPDFRATELASMAVGNILEYCRILLDAETQAVLDKQRTRSGAERITSDRIRSLLVRATGLATLARDKIKEHVKAEHERKYER